MKFRVFLFGKACSSKKTNLKSYLFCSLVGNDGFPVCTVVTTGREPPKKNNAGCRRKSLKTKKPLKILREEEKRLFEPYYFSEADFLRQSLRGATKQKTNNLRKMNFFFLYGGGEKA